MMHLTHLFQTILQKKNHFLHFLQRYHKKILIDKIILKGKLRILCGGSGLYIRSLLNNISFSDEQRNDELRAELNERYINEGGEVLLKELAEFDPECAARLSPTNSKRIIRAIEIYHTTGVTMTEQIARSRLVPSPYDVTAIGLTFADRAKLEYWMPVDHYNGGMDHVTRHLLYSRFWHCKSFF